MLSAMLVLRPSRPTLFKESRRLISPANSCEKCAHPTLAPTRASDKARDLGARLSSVNSAPLSTPPSQLKTRACAQ
ncbi:hypothetical protein D6817_00885 [Candidatus Pacearchaeota archaeon]|nr:MAG: hypothetical protein D6817_00885 [Candidatus Pacearchaeota archaeon]